MGLTVTGGTKAVGKFEFSCSSGILGRSRYLRSGEGGETTGTSAAGALRRTCISWVVLLENSSASLIPNWSSLAETGESAN